LRIEMPEAIEIGGVTYRIEHDEKAVEYLKVKGWFGAQDANEGWIRVDGSPHRVMETFLHEVVHAANYELAHAALDENSVSSISTGLTQVLKQLGVEIVV